MAGEWPNTWRRRRLGEVADVNWGDTSTTKASYSEVGFPAFSASGMDGHLPYADFDRTGVVLSAIGADCGKTWLAKGKWSCIKNTIRFWATDPEVDTEFLYWLTRDPSFWPKRGSAQPFISQGDARAVEIAYPRLPEQRAIAHILGTLDDKIELNRRMSETLEAMARALFKAWFVDFEPVRAKMEGRWQRGQSLPGLPAHLYDLFPDRLVESELGEIPEGWTIARAGEIYDVGIGKTPPRKESHWFSKNPKDIPWMSIKDLGNSGVYISEVSEYLTAEAVERFRVRRIPANTVVLSFKLTVGRVAITDSEMLSNEAIAHFIPKEGNKVSAPYLYCYLKQFDYGSLGSTSSIATAVNSDSIRSIPILAPVETIGEAFDVFANKSFAQIRSKQRESHFLSQLRDTLLPKLISGELRVHDAERFLKERGL